MKTTHMIGGIALMLLASSAMVSAWHIAPGQATASEFVGGGLGNVVTLCESEGDTDPVNALPAPAPGVGGLCYATCEAGTDDLNATYLKAKKDDVQDTFCSITPTGGVDTNGLDDDFFIRIGSNARSCNGDWGDEFVYKQALAYFAGGVPDSLTGISGHVTLFINDPLTAGSYDAVKPFTGSIDATATALACSGNWLGLAA